MTASRSASSDRLRPKSGEAVILFSVGGSRFAIAASAVEEIRDLNGLRKISLGMISPKFEKVKQLLERQGRNYFVVDSCEHFRLAMTRPSRLLVLRHAAAGVVVDGIDSILELHTIQALPRAFSGEERNWYRGLALVNGKVVPVVKPEAFLSKTDVVLLQASMRSSAAAAGIGILG
jgi:chemotaxis signal transduction protein